MPRKGFFTQCVCILLEQVISLGELQARLGDFNIVNQTSEITDKWMFSGPNLRLEFDPEVNGYMSVDIVDQKWPDHMGNTTTETFLFGAWTTGQFGPITFPGGLERAVQQSWFWEAAKENVAKHKAFIRLRLSYLFGANESSPIFPEDYNAIDEMEFMNDAVSSLLALPAALCYFNPGGEVLRNQADFSEELELSRAANQPPLSLWSNIRLFNFDDQWSVMDSVGMDQFDLSDSEACFEKSKFDPKNLDKFLRNLNLYRTQTMRTIEDGDPIDEPGGMVWIAQSIEESICSPPRRVLRLLSKSGAALPAALQRIQEI